MFSVMKRTYVLALLVAAAGNQAANAQESIKLGEETVIEINGNPRPIGCYTHTVSIPNKPGRKLQVEMSAAGNKLQVAVLDPNKKKGTFQNWGVAQLSGAAFPKDFHKDKLDWTMQDSMPGEKIFLQFQSESKGKVKVLVDWAPKD